MTTTMSALTATLARILPALMLSASAAAQQVTPITCSVPLQDGVCPTHTSSTSTRQTATEAAATIAKIVTDCRRGVKSYISCDAAQRVYERCKQAPHNGQSMCSLLVKFVEASTRNSADRAMNNMDWVVGVHQCANAMGMKTGSALDSADTFLAIADQAQVASKVTAILQAKMSVLSTFDVFSSYTEGFSKLLTSENLRSRTAALYADYAYECLTPGARKPRYCPVLGEMASQKNAQAIVAAAEAQLAFDPTPIIRCAKFLRGTH